VFSRRPKPTPEAVEVFDDFEYQLALSDMRE
jgi:hypothetical protein